MRRPMRSISEGPTRPHAADSQRWWKAGEGGVVKRETRPPPKAFLRQDWSRPLSQPTVPATAKDNSRSKKQDQGALEKLHSRRGPRP